MNPRRSIYGQIANCVFIKNVGTKVIGIDQARLVARLLLFDEVVISTVRLQELPYLVKIFGVAGLTELLSTNILRLSSDTVIIAIDFHKNGIRDLPLLEFSQGIIDITDREEFVRDGLHSLLQVTGLKNIERNNVGELIQERILKPSSSFGKDLLSQVRVDLRTNVKLVRSVFIKEHPELSNQLDGLIISLNEVKVGHQRFETNLREILNVDVVKEHEMLSKTVGAITRLNEKLALMQEYQSLSSFDLGDAELLFGKFAGLISPYNPKIEEEQFLRVLEVAEIPEFRNSGKVDVPKLLEARESSECREFRAWLTQTDKIEEGELRDLLTGFRARTANFIASPNGKIVRFVVNAGLGLIPGYGTGMAVAEGVVDNFFLDKLFPSSGALSFLSKSIPSIMVG